MAVRQICKACFLSLLNKNGAELNSSNSISRLLSSSMCSGTSSSTSNILYREPRWCTGISLVSNWHNRRMLTTAPKPQSSSEEVTVKMGSILQHLKYKEMKSKLSKRNSKSLGPLDTASLYILSFKELNVNLEILRLDALSPTSRDNSKKSYAEIQEMKQRGAVKKGKLNKEDETAIEERFETLLAETGLDKEALMEELFAANSSSIKASLSSPV